MNITHGVGALGLPAAALSAATAPDMLNAQVVVIGAPFDGGVTSVPGQRHGPEILRALSPSYDWSTDPDTGSTSGPLDPVRRGPLLTGLRVFDVGDIGDVPIDPRVSRAQYYSAVEQVVSGIVASGAVPVVIGGDHSITAPVVRAITGHLGSVSLACFDAHCDFSTRSMPRMADMTHADFIGHLMQTGALDDATVFGVRAHLPEAWGPLPEQLRCIAALPIRGSLEMISGPCHVSIDLDVLDPSELPATGHPEPGGARLIELLEALREVFRTRTVVAVDIVEALQDDANNRATAAVMARVIAECLASLNGQLDARTMTMEEDQP